MPHCTVCLKKLPSINGLYLHMDIYHKKEVNQAHKCKERNCYRTLNNWKDFRRHLRTCHKFSSHKSLRTTKREGNVQHNICLNVEDCDDADEFFDAFEEPVTVNIMTQELAREQIFTFALIFVAKLYANSKLPRNFVQIIVEDFSNLLSNIMDVSKQYMENSIRDLSLENSSVVRAALNDILKIVLEPFGTILSSEYKRLKVFTESGKLIPAIDVVVGDELRNVLSEQRIVQEIIPLKAKFVPIRKILQEFLILPNVLTKILNYIEYLKVETRNGIISNFMQGEVWQEKLTHFVGKIVLPIFLYFDDFEVNNALGSHANVSKLGAVYFQLPCLPPEYRSKLEFIFSTLLFYTIDRTRSGNFAIFKVLVDELNFLQSEGLLITVDNKVYRIYFALGLFLGDNLGINSCLGFCESFSANYYCRLCKQPKEDARISCCEEELLLRTIEDYEREGFDNMKNTGVKESSVWNSVLFFHVVCNYVVDIMHDLLEGVCRYDMGQILFYFIYKEKAFTLDNLNSKLKSFNYTYNGFTNKPPLISADDIKNKHVSMSASEMWTFVLIFPLLVGDLVDFTDDVWQFFLLLREIIDICFAKSIQVECCDLIENLVSKHNQMYIMLFNETLKPKFHLMNHYGTIMKKSGPIAHLNALRFEAKHKKKKESALATTSRINLPHTLTLKEQLDLSYRLMSCSGFSDEIELGPVHSYDNLGLHSNYYLFKDSLVGFQGPCVETQWIEINGITYKNGYYIAVGYNSQFLPKFAKVAAIFVDEQENVCFLCERLSTLNFNLNLYAYEISTQNSSLFCIKPEALLTPFVMIQHRMTCGRNYITRRHAF